MSGDEASIRGASRARAIGRLLRLSLAPSAAADVATGLALGAGGGWPSGPAPWLLIGSSLSIYHGAMALNDWADREGDARTRPERPIPSGLVPAGVALALAALMLVGGALLATVADPRAGAWMAALAVTAAAYDLIGRGALLGPALLALCRFGNLAVGVYFAARWTGAHGSPIALLGPPLLYGAYVFFVSRLGRLEDDEDERPLGRRPSRFLLAAAVCLAAVPFSFGLSDPTRIAVSALVAWSGAFGLVRAALARRPWTRVAVGRQMGAALRRLLVFTAASALLGCTWGSVPIVVAAASLAGYPIAFALRRVFPPS